MSCVAESATINVSMPPRQSYQPSPQPQQPQRQGPQQAPRYGYGYGYDAIPGQPHHQPHFQQHPNGHYEVLPTPQVNPNDGHSGHNPYDFIVNPNSSAQRVKFGAGLSGSSLITRIALLGGVLVVVLIVAAVVISALSPKSSTPELISIAERQQEIVRVSTAATKQTTSQDAQNFVSNVQASVSSDQQQVLAYLQAHGTKLGDKILATDQSAQTDTQLGNAATANNYDSAVTQTLVSELQTYQGLLRTMYGQTNSSSAKAMVQIQFSSAGLLIQQGQALEKELNS